MERCFLTIIIPVYNAARYLGETLDSLLEQDIPDYEILCINDGSTDASPEILEGYRRRHSQVRVIHQENGGVAAARNTGLDQARGDYIWFVDADDLVPPNVLGKCKALAEESRCQRLTFDAYTFTDILTAQDWEAYAQGSLPSNSSWRDIVVWRNWLKRDFLLEKGLRFRYPDITHGEDNLFLFEVCRENPHSVDIPDFLYFYRIHANSAETGASLATRRKRLYSHIRVVEVLMGYYRAEGSAMAATRLMSLLWLSLYEIAGLPAPDAAQALQRLKEQGLYPMEIPRECTLRKTFLVDDSTAAGKVLEFFCGHLHRPWGYGVIRTLHQVKKIIRRG